MTLEEVRQRVDALSAGANGNCDKEGWHSMEDELYHDFLRALATGRVEQPDRCAAELVRLQGPEFDGNRWYA